MDSYEVAVVNPVAEWTANLWLELPPSCLITATVQGLY